MPLTPQHYCSAKNRWHLMKLQVTVKPNARQQRIVENDDGSLTVHLTSPPVDGKANAELIKLLAKNYGVSKSRVTIKLGHTSRQKLVEIEPD